MRIPSVEYQMIDEFPFMAKWLEERDRKDLIAEVSAELHRIDRRLIETLRKKGVSTTERDDVTRSIARQLVAMIMTSYIVRRPEWREGSLIDLALPGPLSNKDR